MKELSPQPYTTWACVRMRQLGSRTRDVTGFAPPFNDWHLRAHAYACELHVRGEWMQRAKEVNRFGVRRKSEMDKMKRYAPRDCIRSSHHRRVRQALLFRVALIGAISTRVAKA